MNELRAWTWAKAMTRAKVRGAARGLGLARIMNIDGTARLILMVDKIINKFVLFLLLVKGQQVQPFCIFSRILINRTLS